MYETLTHIFGEGRDLTAYQSAARAVVIFFICILFIRIAGRRLLGINTALDTVISILLGAVMSRAISGASDFWPTCAAGFTLVCLHRLFAWLTFRSRTVGRLMKGSPLLIYENGKILRNNLSICCVTENDLMEAIRERTNQDSLDKIDRIYAERNGSISIILEKKV
jgi:uncharacterized membrane protein YcaP (DUF421 family)